MIEFRVLGSVEVVEDDQLVALGGPQQRALLAALLVHRREPVSSDRLIDELWGERPPPTARKIVQGYVSGLRKVLGDGLLVSRANGYVLQVEPGQTDVDRFDALAAEGQRALTDGDARRAAELLREALSLWRGPALAEFAYESFAQSEIARLEEARLSALEGRIEADLVLGRSEQLVSELEALVHEHPLRERLVGQLMLALYRSGRQADALEAFRAARGRLVEELGLEPGPELQELERAILVQDQALGTSGRPRVGAPAAGRGPGRAPLLIGGGGVALVAALIALALTLASSGASSFRIAPNTVAAIDVHNGQVTQALPVDAQPTSVAVGDGSIWVVSATTGTLFRINQRSGSAIPIPVGSDPVAVTVARDGSVWVANSGDGTVARVSPENNAVVARIPVEGGPSALVATSDAVWVANTLNASVSRIDLSSDRAGPPIPVGSEPSGIAVGGDSIWVANQGDGTVSRLDPQTGAPVAGPITVGDGPRGIAFGDGAAWVANSIDGTLSRIDAQTNNVETIGVGQGPYDVAVRAGHVWVSDEYGNAVTEVDPAKFAVTRTIQAHSAPLGLALAGDRLWVATDGIGAVAHRGGVLYALASGFNGPNGGDPPSIDPGSAEFTQLDRPLVMTSDGLVGYRRQGGVAGNALVPDLALAKPAPTDNGLTYTFRIRSGIRYSNGVPLRASDFRRGLERSFRLGNGIASFFTALVGGQNCLKHAKTCDLSRGVVADDAADTVTFHLTHPDPNLFDQLTLPVAYPVPPGTPLHPRSRSVPGTGPYQISSYSPAKANDPRSHGRLILTRNRYFREWSAAAQPLGFPDRIVVRSNYSQTQQIDAVKAGRADLAWDSIPGRALAALDQSFPSQVHNNTLAETDYLWLNARTPPFNNLLARRAFNYAVDRGALAQYVAPDGSVGRPTCQLLPPDFPAYVPYCPYTVDPASSGRWLAADLSKAQALVRQSGTMRAQVTFVNPSFAGRRFGQMVVNTLRTIGYRARLVEAPGSQYFSSTGISAPWARLQAGFSNWIQDYLAPSDFFQSLVTCSAITTSFNIGGFCDHGLDAGINKALANQVLNPGVASQEWTAIDRTVVDQAVDVPIRNELDSDFVARRVGNYQYNPQWGVLVDQLWVR